MSEGRFSLTGRGKRAILQGLRVVGEPAETQISRLIIEYFRTVRRKVMVHGMLLVTPHQAHYPQQVVGILVGRRRACGGDGLC